MITGLLDSNWLNDFAAAQEKAERENKVILLYFSGSDWCGPCIRLKKEVFDSGEFSALAENRLVLVRADFPRQKKNKLSPEQTTHNEALAERFNSAGKFPLVVLMNPHGEVIHEWDGYIPGAKDKFLKELAEEITPK
jgi:thioredoxin-related protein